MAFRYDQTLRNKTIRHSGITVVKSTDNKSWIVAQLLTVKQAEFFARRLVKIATDNSKLLMSRCYWTTGKQNLQVHGVSQHYLLNIWPYYPESFSFFYFFSYLHPCVSLCMLLVNSYYYFIVLYLLLLFYIIIII